MQTIPIAGLLGGGFRSAGRFDHRRHPHHVQSFLSHDQTFDRIEVLLADRAFAADPKVFKDFEQRLSRQLPVE